jgi:hypothetical protein
MKPKGLSIFVTAVLFAAALAGGANAAETALASLESVSPAPAAGVAVPPASPVRFRRNEARLLPVRSSADMGPLAAAVDASQGPASDWGYIFSLASYPAATPTDEILAGAANLGDPSEIADYPFEAIQSGNAAQSVAASLESAAADADKEAKKSIKAVAKALGAVFLEPGRFVSLAGYFHSRMEDGDPDHTVLIGVQPDGAMQVFIFTFSPY